MGYIVESAEVLQNIRASGRPLRINNPYGEFIDAAMSACQNGSASFGINSRDDGRLT
jgi:hypothetical protein